MTTRPITGKCASCGGAHAVAWDKNTKKWAADPCKPKPTVEAVVLARKDGMAMEVKLADALDNAGLTGWEAQWPWGMLLSPARRFQADIGFPKHRVIVESVGRAHSMGVEKVYADAERSALAASIGILVVPLHPGLINDGTGVELVRRALASRVPAVKA